METKASEAHRLTLGCYVWDEAALRAALRALHVSASAAYTPCSLENILYVLGGSMTASVLATGTKGMFSRIYTMICNKYWT
jgi:hypothetical protein